MKKFVFRRHFILVPVLVLAGCTSSREPAVNVSPDDPSVVAVAGNEVITLDQFEKEYTTSAGAGEDAGEDSLSAYRNFLERYVDFRLKVAEARALGLHQDPAFLQEVEAHRVSLARPYLLEREILEPIMRMLYERMQEAVNTSHILIEVARDASPEDTLSAYRRAVALRDSLLGGADFGDLAFRHSEDPSAQMQGQAGYRGQLGFISSGVTVAPFEEMAYNTPAGQISPVFRTQFGYHILRVENRQPNIPDRRVAHIMLPSGGQSISAHTASLQKLQEIRSRLLAGEDFSALANQYSVHGESAAQGGDLGIYLNYYREGSTPETFKKAAFALENVGDISDVVVSEYGYHLIKLLDIQGFDSYEEGRETLRQMASALPQARAAEQEFIAGTQQRFGIRIDSAAVFQVFGDDPARSVWQRLSNGDLTAQEASTMVFQIGDSTYTLADLAAFSTSPLMPRSVDTREYLRTLLDQFADAQTVNYAAAAWEAQDPGFRSMMDDFRDGLLLFRIMEDSVWTAAAEDVAGQEAYYREHAGEYRFPDRTLVLVFSGEQKEQVEHIAQRLESGASPAGLAAELTGAGSTVRVDTSYVSDASHPIYGQALSLAQGQHTEVIQQGVRWSVLVRGADEPARPMTPEEARPHVIGDYQEVVENRWVQRLRREHGVRTYPDRLARAFEPESPSLSSAAGTPD